MKKIETTTSNFAANCSSCGRILTNPGYGKQNVYCCGKYRRWYNTTDYTYEIDDGRNEKGQFHHKQTKKFISKEVRIRGGE